MQARRLTASGASGAARCAMPGACIQSWMASTQPHPFPSSSSRPQHPTNTATMQCTASARLTVAPLAK